jgi:hypothetical protein
MDNTPGVYITAPSSRKEAGYFWSDLSPEYQSYDRDLFIATLDDWKWFGAKGQEPAWYFAEKLQLVLELCQKSTSPEMEESFRFSLTHAL